MNSMMKSIKNARSVITFGSILSAGVYASTTMAAIITYSYTASIPFDINTTPYESFGNTTLNGTFVIDTDSVVPIAGDGTYGLEGTTAMQPLTVNVSNGMSLTYDRNWYVKDFTKDYWLISSKAAAGLPLTDGKLISYFYDKPEPFNSDISLIRLTFIIPKIPGSTGNLLSTGQGMEVAGKYGQIDLTSSAGPFIGISLSDVNFSVVPIPAAVWLFGSGLICLIGLARHSKV